MVLLTSKVYNILFSLKAWICDIQCNVHFCVFALCACISLVLSQCIQHWQSMHQWCFCTGPSMYDQAPWSIIMLLFSPVTNKCKWSKQKNLIYFWFLLKDLVKNEMFLFWVDKRFSEEWKGFFGLSKDLESRSPKSSDQLLNIDIVCCRLAFCQYFHWISQHLYWLLL